MSVSHDHVTRTVAGYLARYPEDTQRLSPLLEMLDHGQSDMTARSTLPGHVTCGAFLTDRDGRVLLIQHRALSRWLLPGGHVESGDETLVGAALRELVEETGIAPETVGTPAGREHLPIDVDVHVIPANPQKGEPEHWHADFRFAFRVDTADVALCPDEVTGADWVRPAEVGLSGLIARSV